MDLNWILIVWSMAASASLTLGAMHLIAWLRSEHAPAHLLFLVTAIAGAVMAFFELRMMWARTPEDYSVAVRWIHVPIWVLILALTAFVLVHLDAGRSWLAWAVVSVRTLALVLNFQSGLNLNFLEVSGLRHAPFLGGVVTVPEGVVNPWMLVGSLGMLLFVVFVVDAAITVWRRGDHRSALVTGGGIVLCASAGAVEYALIVLQVLDWPFMGSLFFMAIVAATSYEMGSQVVAAAQASTRLRASEARLAEIEQRLDDAAAAGGLGSWEWSVQRDAIWANDRCRDLLGLGDERLVFANVFAVIHPDDRQAVQDALTVSLEKSFPLELEFRVLLPGGKARWILTRGRVTSAAASSESVLHGVSIDITARKQLEERFRRVVDVAPVGFMILGEGGTIDLVNAWIETAFGYAPRQLIGLPIQSILPQFASHSVGGEPFCLVEAITKGRVAGLKSTGRRADGTELELEIHADSIPPINGSGVQILVTLIDISDRERSQRALAKERAFLRQVIDIDPNLIFAKDREGRFTLANQAVADIYGTTVQDLIGKTDADFNSKPEEVANFRRVDLEVMDSLNELRVPEEEITDADGRVHVLQTVKRPILGPGNVAHQLVGTATDITARKLAEESIRSSEEFSRSILASLQDHVVILDRDGVVLAVNDAWAEFDMPAGTPTPMGEGTVGSNYLDVCSYVPLDGDMTGERAREGIRSVLSGRSASFSMEYSPNWPSATGWILMRVLPLKRSAGGVVVSHRDITQRKEAELEFVQQRNELAHFSRVTMLGQLSGSLAHELNQPLAAILSNAQAALRFLADENYDREEVREILGDIVSDDKRAGDVIQGLRTLLKKGETRHELVDLNDMVRDVAKLVRSEMVNARVSLKMELVEGLPPIAGDRVQIEQVLLNLVMNGCDAMANSPVSERELLVRTGRRDRDEVEVCVVDRGAGLRHDEIEKVFEPFYTTKVGGLGLGLVVSRKIINAHGGRLQAAINPGGGATFCFSLPTSSGDCK